jgi:RNA polymerase sigma-70 factor, ECF subfamily
MNDPTLYHSSSDPLQVCIDEAVVRVRGGDRDAYRTVIEACETRLRLVIAGILPDASQVEDVVQQSFVLAYTKLDQYHHGTGFIAWIATIARYEALNERRRWLSERSMRQRYSAELRIEQTLGTTPEPLDGIDHATVAGLHDCIEALQGRAASVVRAHYFENRDNDTIAADHGRNTAWVRLVLHRARQALADCLKLKHGVRCAES